MEAREWLIVAVADVTAGEVIKERFKEAHLVNPVQVVDSAAAFSDFCAGPGTGDSFGRQRFGVPRLILVDLDIGAQEARTVVSRLKRDEKFRDVPLVVLVSEQTESLLDGAYEAGADSYLRKPVKFEELIQRARMLDLGIYIVSEVAP